MKVQCDFMDTGAFIRYNTENSGRPRMQARERIPWPG
jgi:hypothetical protein